MQGKGIVVTGGFGNLGRACAEAFVNQGANVAVLDRAESPLDSGIEGLSQVFAQGGVDLTDPYSARTALEAAHRALGAIDVVVNVAGGFRWQKLQDSGEDIWDLMYSLNLKTAVNTCRAALPILLAQKRAGRIINVGAMAAGKALAGMGAYAASKAGVQRLTESLADEVLSSGITVNCVLPGIIDTPQNRADMPKAEFSSWVQPAAIADVILFLASNSARAISGAAIPVHVAG